MRTQTKFGRKIFEIDMLMKFYLLTSPQGHQFDPRMKMFLAFYSARHSRRFTGPRSAVGSVSGYRCMSDCRSRGREFDPGPVPYFRGDWS